MYAHCVADTSVAFDSTENYNRAARKRESFAGLAKAWRWYYTDPHVSYDMVAKEFKPSPG
jgi:hypothetical protein